MPTDRVTTIDFVADILCPWCFIARRRLDLALAELAAEKLVLAWRWRPYLLHPAAVPQAQSWHDSLLRRFGSLAAADRYHRGVEEAGRAVGIMFRYDLIRRTPDTRLAQALLLLASPWGLQGELAERLAAAFFTAGKDIGDVGVLETIAVAAGLTANLLRDTDSLLPALAEVAASDQAAKQAGLTAVPAFCFHGRILPVPDPAELAVTLRSAHAVLGATASATGTPAR